MATQNLKKNKNNNFKDQKRTRTSKDPTIIKPLSTKQASRFTEEAMHGTERFLSGVFSSIQDGISILDKDMNIIRVNQAMERWYSYAMPLIGKKCYEAYHGRSERCKICPTYQTINTGKVAYEVVPKTGASREIVGWLDLYSFPFIDAVTGKMVGVIEYVRDISEQKQAEEALRRSEEKTKRLAQENATMAEIGRIISSTLDIEEVYERFAEETHKLIPFDGIAINIINHRDGTVTVPYVSGVAVPGCQPGDVLPLEGSVTGEVERTRSGFITQTEDKKELQAKFPTLLTAFNAGLRSVIAVPLISKDQVIGAIHFRSAKSKAYSDQDLKLAESIGSQIAGVIANAQLFIERKQAEQALRSERDKFRGMLLAINDGVDIVNKDYIIEFQNELLRERFGDKIGEKCYAAYMGLGEPCHYCSIQEAIQTGSATRIELVGKDGRNYELNSSPFRDVDGEVKVIELVRDITERKQAEKALRESEEKYRTIIENIEDGYFEVDVAGNFTFFNDSLCRILGYSRDEMMGMNDRQYTDQENAKKLYHAFNKVYRTGEPTKGFDWEVIRKDGTIRFIEASVSLIKNSKGQPTGFRGIVRDITDRKQAEETLRQSEERYRTLVEESFDGIWIQKRFKITFANRRFYEMLGYEVGELEGLDHWLVYHPDYQNLTRERAQARMRGESVPSTYEVEFLRKDGSSFWGEVHAKAISFLGEPGIQVWARDISVRKEAEKALCTEKEKFQTLSENAPFGMVMIDKDGTFKYINPKFRELFGYDLTDIPDGKTWFRKAYPDLAHRHHVIAQWMKDLESFERGERIPRIFTATCKDGTEKIVNFITVLLETGEYLIACEDITEHLQSENALKESEERYRMAIESSNDGVAIVRKDRHIYVNKQFVKMFGFESMEEVLGQSPYAWIHPDDREKVIEFNRKRQRGEKVPMRYETRGIRKDGEVVYLEISATRILLHGEYVTFAYLRDITERKRAEEEKAALEEQLRQSQKMEAIGRLGGGIAHDFNNLLTVIKGYSQLSLLDLKESDPLWGNIQEIQKATQRATDLTRQLLAFSRRQILDLKVLDLNILLRDLDKMLRRIIGEDIELVTLLEEKLGRVKIDPGQIEQVIFNLAVNARDAMPSGGKLIIETTNVELDKEYARTHIGVVPGRYVRLSVSDTGFGMSQEISEKVFEPFFTTKDKGKGTGLGLSTVYGIVRQSGGNIWVYSEPGHGTTFKIYLPRVEEELDTLHGRDETDSLPRGTETVLLVEDEPSVRNLAHHLLHQQGYKVLEATNGEEALRVNQEHVGETIHLLLTDVVMPQMGGKELADQLKILRPGIKVLYASGYTDDAIVHHGVLEPGTHFLQKPFSLKTLSHKVREVLDREIKMGR